MVKTFKIITHDEILFFLKEFNKIKFTTDLNNFLLVSKNILYGPKLSKIIFKSEDNICQSRGFENINLGKYWTDILIYQINKLDTNELIKDLKSKNMLNNSDNLELTKGLIMTKNDYPYIVPNTTYNYFLLWNLETDVFLNVKNVESMLYSQFKDRDYIIWRNPSIYKSVKTIEHFHIISRPAMKKLYLKKLFIVSRHGPREPIFVVPKFIHSYWQKISHDHTEAVYGANLTEVGKLYCVFMGKLLHFNYNEDFDFSQVNHSNSIVTSTNFNRTIESAMLTLDGMGLTNKYSDIKITDFISSDTVFSSEQKKSYNDKMNNPQIKWDVDLNELNSKIFQLTGIKIHNFRNYFDIACTMRCYEFHNYQMLPDDNLNEKLLELKPTIYNLSTYYYNIVHNPKDEFYWESRVLGTTVLNGLIDLFNNPNYKFGYFSTHDNILMPLVKNLIYEVLQGNLKFPELNYDTEFFTQNIKSKINYLNFPDFNSNIRFEQWEDIDGKKIIRIYYNSLMLFEFS
jgi:hypothetical protein